MKLKFGLILAAALSTSVMAQVNNNPPVVAPESAASTPAPSVTPPDAAPVTPAPAKAKKAKKKKAAKKTAAKKESKAAKAETAPVIPFMANDLATAKQNNINIRGQAHINSEVIGHLQQGETVTVLGEVTLKHAKMDEPAHWVQIALPASIHVWVDSAYLDGTNQMVSARKLNLRGGPGENYSVLGLLHKGDVIKPLEKKGKWTQIEAPTNAFAFVAAHLLSHKEAEPVAPPVVAPPVVAAVPAPEPIAPPPTTTAQLPPPVVIPPPVIPTPEPAVEQPLPKRIVQRDGIVGGTVSIQAPSHYELHSLDNGDVLDYLYTTSTNVTLGRYKGLVVHVTGEESLDERWPNTPVLTIQRIQKIVK